MKAEELFVINPLVYGSLKKYIWFKEDAGQKEAALALFWQFLTMEIYIEGFATDVEEYIGEKAFNKRIVDIRALDAAEDIVFIEQEYEEKLYDICQTITVVNPAVNTKNMIIFGAGKYGTEVYTQLKRRGLGQGVYCFIDSNEAKCGGENYKEGLKIRSIGILSQMSEDISVIEASQMHEEMEHALRERGVVQRTFFYVDEGKRRWDAMYQYKDVIQFGVSYIDELCSKMSGKKIYFYEERNALAEKTGRTLRLLDFTFCGFLHDEVDHKKENDYMIEDILYDENFFILLDKFHNSKQRKKLEELGLKIGIDYNLMDSCGYSVNMDNLMLDLNLGYSYKEGKKYSGFTVYGEEKENDYKIVTLGASTTDGNIIWDKCWPCFLYEKLAAKMEVTIYNGGIAGYSSGQELIKLIRDVLPLNPDLVIVYDGLIDLGVSDRERPFAFPYLEEIFNFARKNMDTLSKNIEIDSGIKSGKTSFDNWLSNIEIMHAVAKLRGIRFLSFVQPSRIAMQSKKKKDSWRFSNISFWRNNYRKTYTDFRQELQNRKIEETHDYIIDLMGIFDDRPEVYMDASHLYEEGNKIIADAIFDTVNKKVFDE